MELYEKIETIETAIETILTDANLGVRNIILGDRARTGNLNPPAIWIFFNDTEITHSGSAINEEWKMQFIVASMIQSVKPEQARKEADVLAAKASKALIKNRTLNDTVRDIVRLRYLPAYSRGQDSQQLYGAGYLLQARFRHIERGD